MAVTILDSWTSAGSAAPAARRSATVWPARWFLPTSQCPGFQRKGGNLAFIIRLGHWLSALPPATISCPKGERSRRHSSVAGVSATLHEEPGKGEIWCLPSWEKLFSVEREELIHIIQVQV